MFMLDAQELTIQLLLFYLTLHPEEIYLILALCLRNPVHAIGRFLDDLLQYFRCAGISTLIACHLQGMDLHTTRFIKRQVLFVNLLRESVQVIHEFLEIRLCYVFDELRPCSSANVTGSISSRGNHQWQVNDLPKECALKDQLDVVLRTAIKLEGHVLSSTIKTLNEEVAFLTTATAAPAEFHSLRIWRQKERPRLISTTFFFAPKIELEIAVLVLDDKGLMVSKSDELPNLFN
mmetsp:Transcript_103423/g.205575  ORF Transcript_103423/g.205575 Transcript_103423/m.205575 type:complete len:234 (-) Transcript_103423:726-1427(-)